MILRSSCNLNPDIPLTTFKETVRLGRQVISDERKRSRRKALRYAKAIRSRSFNKGYQAGLLAARNECAQTVGALRGCYQEALLTAKGDTLALATALAERIIDSTLIEKPETLLVWIEEGLSVLSRARDIHLAFNPRYEGVMRHLEQHLPETIRIHADPSLSDADFIIRSELGGIEFSWRNALNGSIGTHSSDASPGNYLWR